MDLKVMIGYIRADVIINRRFICGWGIKTCKFNAPTSKWSL